MSKTPDLLTALIEARAWVRHWQADLAANLKPTKFSLAKAEADLTVAIVKARSKE